VNKLYTKIAPAVGFITQVFARLRHVLLNVDALGTKKSVIDIYEMHSLLSKDVFTHQQTLPLEGVILSEWLLGGDRCAFVPL
jgi:hypothetical protein